MWQLAQSHHSSGVPMCPHRALPTLPIWVMLGCNSLSWTWKQRGVLRIETVKILTFLNFPHFLEFTTLFLRTCNTILFIPPITSHLCHPFWLVNVYYYPSVFRSNITSSEKSSLRSNTMSSVVYNHWHLLLWLYTLVIMCKYKFISLFDDFSYEVISSTRNYSISVCFFLPLIFLNMLLCVMSCNLYNNFVKTSYFHFIDRKTEACHLPITKLTQYFYLAQQLYCPQHSMLGT